MQYSATRSVYIRKEPRIVQNILGNNIYGMLAAGDKREILSTQTNTNGETWGQLTPPDSNGKSLWVCISNINTIFMTPIETPAPSTATTFQIALYEWACTKGYNGPRP